MTQLSTQYSVGPSGTRNVISRSFFASWTIARRMSPFQPMPKSMSPRCAFSMNVELIVSTLGLTRAAGSWLLDLALVFRVDRVAERRERERHVLRAAFEEVDAQVLRLGRLEKSKQS
jgi:hypothetical protein